MTIAVNTASVFQAIDGFGVDMACFDATVPDAAADLLWSPTKGIGLTWCRLRASVADGSIPAWGATGDYIGGPDGQKMNNLGMVASAIKARDRGARFWALADGENSTPEAWLTVTGDPDYITILDPAHYVDYAASVQKIIAAGAALGLTVEFVSLCNEPDLATQGQYVTDSQIIHDIVAQMAAGSHVILPEAGVESHLASFADPTLADASTRAFVSRAAVHAYGGDVTGPYATAATYGIPAWETEFCEPGNLGADATMASGISVASRIHNYLAVGNYSMFGFFLAAGFKGWTGHRYGLLGDAYANTKRAWTMGNFSKFIRPGAHRVSCSGAPNGVLASAYVNANGSTSVVLINSNASPVAVSLSGLGASSLTPWVTDANRDLLPQPQVAISSGAGSYTLPATSVVTLSDLIPTPPMTLTGPGSLDAGASASWDVQAPGGPARLTIPVTGTGTLRVLVDGANPVDVVVP